MLFEDTRRQAPGFIAEEQTIAILVSRLCIRDLAARAEAKDARRVDRGFEIGQAGMAPDVDRMPVIQAGPADDRASSRKPRRPIRCRVVPVAAHNRAMFPVFGGISGSKRATCSMLRLQRLAVVSGQWAANR